MTGVGVEGGGNIVMTYSPPADNVVSIYRAIPQTQGVNFSATEVVDPDSVESAVDRLTLEIQDLKRDVDRSVKVPVAEVSAMNELALADRAGMMIEFDNTGQPTYVSRTTIVDHSGIVAAGEEAEANAALALGYSNAAGVSAAASAASATASANSATASAASATYADSYQALALYYRDQAASIILGDIPVIDGGNF